MSELNNQFSFRCLQSGAAALLLACGAISLAWAGPAVSFPPVDAEPLGHVSGQALVLHEGWQMREEAVAGNHGESFSQPDFSAPDWYATTIPATPLGVLVRHGIYPDPYVGTNMMLIPDMSDAYNQRYHLAGFSHLPDKANPWAKPYWFRTAFMLPAGYHSRTVRLHLDGINYRADVWVNGTQAADATNTVGMFRRFSFDVTRLVKPGQINALAVRIHPLDIPGDPAYAQLDGLAGVSGLNGGNGQILRNVTDYYSVGWDWIPAVADRNIGLWQHVWLEATGPVTVRDPAAFTELNLPDTNRAFVTIRGFLDNAAAAAISAELVTTIRPENFKGSTLTLKTAVNATPGQSEFILKPAEHPELVLKAPQLWWPLGYGAQPLYRVTVEARVQGQPVSRASSLMGVRKVGTYVLKSGGRAFTVNGRTIRLVGGAWIPDMLLSWSAQRYRDEVRLIAEGNQTLVRVNGCAIMPPDCFFDECDRRGLLIWEDFSRTSVEGPTPDCDTQVLVANTRDYLARMRGHPSVLVWCGANEALPQKDFDLAMQDQVLPEMDGTRPFLVSSTVDADWAKLHLHTWSGGPYSLQRLTNYFKLYGTMQEFTCKNEIGLASPPSINTLARFLPDLGVPADSFTFPLNLTTGFHDATGSWYRDTDAEICRQFGFPASTDDYLWQSDLFNGMAYRAIFEAANKFRPRNAGTTTWKINASWPGFMWQVFDWTLRPNAGYYAMKKAARPLHVQHSEDDQGIQVVSTLAKAQPGLQVRLTLTGLQGNTQYTDTRPVEAAADATTPVGKLPQPQVDGQLHFLALDLLDSQGRILDRDVKWTQREGVAGDLMKLPVARLETSLVRERSQNGEVVQEIRVCNRSAVAAVNAWLELLAGSQGREVLPSFWSDNALTLLPGETRNVTVRFRKSLLAEARPHLMVEGFNVLPAETSLANGRVTPLAVKMAGLQVDEAGSTLRASVAAEGNAGQRQTTWPLELFIDGRFARTVRVSVSTARAGTIALRLPELAAGEHQLALGSHQPVTFRVPQTLWQLTGVQAPATALEPRDPGDVEYTIGRSGTNDWPVLHPGPQDLWAGSKPHTFAINFNLAKVDGEGAGQLVLELAQIQPVFPPVLKLALNGWTSTLALPPGSETDLKTSLNSGRSCLRVVSLPAGALKPGANRLTLTTEQGSWLVYKAIRFLAPADTTLGPATF